MYKSRRKLFSQNFLHNRKLISKLLGHSSLGKKDLVLEIGPGKGIITEQLIKRTKHVLAVELDSHLFNYLQQKFRHISNLTVCNKDFLQCKLPHSRYKVFANIPFSIEGKIIRKLIDAKNPPEDCYVVMMKELAYRLAAPYKENLFSIQHKPWFTFSVYHRFNREDFTPAPSVDVVMMRFTKRNEPLLPWKELYKYQWFIIVGFGNGTPAFYNLKKKYGNKRVAKAFIKLNVRRDTKPAYLTLRQWISLYNELQSAIL